MPLDAWEENLRSALALMERVRQDADREDEKNAAASEMPPLPPAVAMHSVPDLSWDEQVRAATELAERVGEDFGATPESLPLNLRLPPPEVPPPPAPRRDEPPKWPADAVIRVDYIATRKRYVGTVRLADGLGTTHTEPVWSLKRWVGTSLQAELDHRVRKHRAAAALATEDVPVPSRTTIAAMQGLPPPRCAPQPPNARRFMPAADRGFDELMDRAAVLRADVGNSDLICTPVALSLEGATKALDEMLVPPGGGGSASVRTRITQLSRLSHFLKEEIRLERRGASPALRGLHGGGEAIGERGVVTRACGPIEGRGASPERQRASAKPASPPTPLAQSGTAAGDTAFAYNSPRLRHSAHVVELLRAL